MSWRLSPLTCLHWHRWDNEWVAFDDGSGQTFQVDAQSVALLLLLETAPIASVADLHRRLNQEMLEFGLAPPSAGDMDDSYLTRLDFFVKQGLVEQLIH